jgi:transcription elongation factor S-II
MSDQSTVAILKQRLEKTLQKDDELEDASSLESCKDCLERLDQVEMTMPILKESLIGVTIAKFKPNATLGPTAKALIQKWKRMAKKEAAPAAKKPNAKAARRDSASSNGEADASVLTAVSEEFADLAPNRQKICQKLYPLLLKAKPNLLEAGMNDEAVEKCLIHTAVEIEAAIGSAFRDRKAYVDKVRSIAFNLKNNMQLSLNLVFGAVTCDELVKMSAEELASEEQRKQRAEQDKKSNDSKRLDWDQANEDKINAMCGITGDLLNASLFTCGRCKSIKTTSTQKQTRSADEPMTVFVLCLNCGTRWKC